MNVSGHIRTIWPVVRRLAATPSAPASEPWSVAVADPARGSVRLTGRLSRVLGSRDLLVLVHGLGGSTDSTYMLRTAAVADRFGLSTLRLNLRGADRLGEDLYHAGLSSDLAAVLASPALAEFDSILLFGFSLGGHISLRYATEVEDPRLQAVAAACSPLVLDRSVAAIDQPSKWIYRRYVLAGLCEMYARVAARHTLPLSAADACRVRSIRSWDRLTVAPRFGFASAEDYYRRASVGGHLEGLRVPALLVAAEDDPMLPAEAILDGLDRAPDHWHLRWVPRGGHLAFGVDLDLGEDAAPKGLAGQVIGWLLRHKSSDGVSTRVFYAASRPRMIASGGQSSTQSTRGADMPSPLQSLEPISIWSHFDAIRKIPRPSKHEEKISQYVREWAAEHSFEVRSDASGNMVVVVPASPGREGAPIVVLQAHLDMVCEKNAGVQHDFMTDAIRIQVDGDWVSAVGTTLGADNGLGAASAMAMAVDPSVEHGPLELLFTLDEETGLNGAGALDPGIVTGRILVNLDTEEDDSVYIGCAGAAGIEASFNLDRSSASIKGELFELSVRGLRGGHSGVDIIENRGNAIKIAARLLVAAIDDGVDFDLISFSGGSKRNAIARECFVRLALESGARQRMDELADALRQELAAELATIDPGLAIELRAVAAQEPGDAPISASDRDRILRVIAAVPHGVSTMSREVAGLVETSNNLAVVTTESHVMNVLCSLRSSVTPALTGTLQALRSLFVLAGGEVEEEAGYPGWKPDPDSPVVQRTVAVYERLFNESPHIKAVHAGLECGILTQKIPGLDAVSIGPEIRNAHSPDEKARISSSRKFYALLRELLAELGTSTS